jgi:hypothetical protein
VLQGKITALDGWRFTWEVQCVECDLANKCKHNCGHPGRIKVFSPIGLHHHISGQITQRSLERARTAFEQEHPKAEQLAFL